MPNRTAATSNIGLLDRLLELRMITGVLFGVYGVACIVWGIGFTTADELKRAAGINVNLVAGIGMFLVSACFIAWALLKPLTDERSGPDEPAGSDTPSV